jgi:hypothetical protein
MQSIERRREIQKAFYYRHRERMIKKSVENKKKRRAANPEKYKETLRKQKHSRLKKLYNLTSDQWWDMFEQQGSSCKICKAKETAGHNWHTDHCHETNKVRGILCYHCNLLLGMAKDNISVLEQAIDYLKTHRKETVDA